MQEFENVVSLRMIKNYAITFYSPSPSASLVLDCSFNCHIVNLLSTLVVTILGDLSFFALSKTKDIIVSLRRIDNRECSMYVSLLSSYRQNFRKDSISCSLSSRVSTFVD